MNKPVFFEHQIVQPDDMTFLVDATDAAVTQNLALFTSQQPGIVAGMNLGGTVGLTTFNVSQGYGYNSSGERLQVFPTTGIAYNIGFTGTQPIYARLGSPLNYNPDPSVNPLGAFGAVQSINPDTGLLENVQSFNNVIIDNLGISGSDIFLGTITADNTGKFVSTNTSSANQLMFIGAFNLNTKTINGSVLATGTVDSTRFTNPLTAAIYLGTGASLYPTGSGINNLGTISAPFGNVYSTGITVHQIHGMSPILVDTLNLVGGSSIESQTGRVLIDTAGVGTQFGSTIYSSSLQSAVMGDLSLSTPSGNINLVSASGNINLQNSVNVGSVANPQALVSYGPITGGAGLTITGPVNFTGANITISQNNFNSKNLLSNSDFSMGVPLYWTGLSMFTGTSATSNFKSGLSVLSPWEPRYSSVLTPYNWTASGISPYNLICGAALPNPECVGLNEIQQITFLQAGTGTVPITGVMQIAFSGLVPPTFLGSPVISTGNFSMNGAPVTAANLQSGLRSLLSIGGSPTQPNIVVTSGISASIPGALTYTLSFQSGLSNLNLAPIVASRISASGGSWVPNVTTIQNGYTPIPSGNVVKDMSSWSGIGLGTYARFSGSTVTQANPMAIYAPLNNIQLSDYYNISFFNKTTSDNSNLEYWVGIVPAPGSGASFSKAAAYTQSSWQGWSRLSAVASTIGIYDNFYAAILIRPTGAAMAVTGVLAQIAGVQVTHGPNLFGYANNDPTVLNIIEPSGVTNAQTSGWTFNANDPIGSFWSIPMNVGTAYVTVSGSFYSPGGMVTISSEAVTSEIGNFLAGADMRPRHNIVLDGRTIKSQIACDVVYDNDTGGGETDYNAGWNDHYTSYSGYIPKGNHTVLQTWSPTNFGGIPVGVQTGYKTTGPFDQFTPDGFQCVMPRLTVTIHQ